MKKLLTSALVLCMMATPSLANDLQIGHLACEATVGVGLGGNVLIGGSNRSFALQPFSGQAQTGLNVAFGLAGLTLR